MKTKRFLSAVLALLLVCSLPVSAFADPWYLENGDITVSATESGQTVSQGTQVNVPDSAPVITQYNSETSTTNTVTITAGENATANVTIQDVNIDARSTGEAAIQTTGNGNVTIELDGENTVHSGASHAGVEKNNSGNLTITDENGIEGTTDSLTATGGVGGAGIGGCAGQSSTNITITGGNIEATSGGNSSGIGGGVGGSGSIITITGGKVTAKGKDYAAGIGGSGGQSGTGITISGGDVTAYGGSSGAGIGGGAAGVGSEIIISDGDVKAYGGNSASGIGGGAGGDGYNITISGGEVTADGGEDGAGIGGGAGGSGSSITIKNDAVVTAKGSNFAADIGDGPHNGCTEKQLNKVDVSGLYTTGSVNSSHGTVVDPNQPPMDEEKPDLPSQSAGASAAEAVYSAPLYRVINQDGKDIPHQDGQKDGVLTITVDADFASLTGTLGGIQTLKARGIDIIVFVTRGASSSFALSDLLAQGNFGDTYKLTHDGETVTFTLGNGADIDNILK